MKEAILSGDARPRKTEVAWKRIGAPEYTVPLIDLSARRRKEQIQNAQAIRGHVLLVSLLLACMGFVFLPLALRMAAVHKKLTVARADTIQWRERSQALSKLGAVLDSKVEDWTRFQESSDRRRAYNNLCSLIAARLPDTVYLEQIQIDSRSEQEHIVLIGGAESMGALQSYIRSFSGIDFITNLRLAETTPFGAMGPDAIHFRIEASGNGALSIPKE